jgi:alpha-L-fucosidase
MHHDNFAMWGSEVTPWNIENIFGRDTCAELEQAFRARGMKFVMSFHHAYSWRYYVHAYNYDAKVPGNEKLYFTPHTDDVRQTDPEAAQFRKEWLAKLIESINKYQPDLIWFDWGIAAMPEEPVLDFFTHYLNSAHEWGRDVVVTFKNNPKKRFPGDFTVFDHERGGELELTDEPWLNDTSVGPWFYNANWGAKAKIQTDTLVELLIDLVSKNGCLLLNIPPDELGRIPEPAVRALKEMGAWLRANGESIYETRPWVIAEEGENPIQAKMSQLSVMTAEDFRFTRSKDNDTLYATALAWPEDGVMRIQTLAKDRISLKSLKSITRVDSGKPLKWKQTDDALEIKLGRKPEIGYAYAVKIQFEGSIPELK